MHNLMDTLYIICEATGNKLDYYADKIEKQGNGKEFPMGDLDAMDKLGHLMKSVKCVIKMLREEDMANEDWGMSERSYRSPMTYRNYAPSYKDGNSNRSYMGGSYVNDSSYRNRNRMGQFTRAEEMDGLMNEMRSMMGSLPENKRQVVERFMEDMERM